MNGLWLTDHDWLSILILRSSLGLNWLSTLRLSILWLSILRLGILRLSILRLCVLRLSILGLLVGGLLVTWLSHSVVWLSIAVWSGLSWLLNVYDGELVRVHSSRD